jgi:DNA-binding NarL/FixJ family response regulator
MKILIVEDHRVVAEGLAALLNDEKDFEVVGIAGSVEEAAKIATSNPPDVALVDFRLPDGNGADAASVVRNAQPDVAVVVLSAEQDDAAVLSAVEAGASGYLLKTESAERILEAVRRAADGEMLIAPRALAELIARRSRRESARLETERLVEKLTPREHEVLELMARGLDNREIAERLHVEYTTSRTHVRSLISKLGAHSKLHAVARAGDLGLIEPGQP